MSSASIARTPRMYRAGVPVPSGGVEPATDDSRLLYEHLDTVGAAVRIVASRNRLSNDMTEELNSRTLLHLVDHDYAVLRQWRRECSLQTYLTAVITRLFLDLRNQEWGKVKPPAMARRLGTVALTLWRLTHRARLTFDEAVKTLQADHGVTATRDQLWDMFSRLPAPSRRYFVEVDELAEMEQQGADAEVLVRQLERRQLASRVERGLGRALEGLSDEERLILKLYFHDGMFLAGIARRLDIDQPRLYPRFRSLLATLRGSLESQGLSVADVAEMVDGGDVSNGRSLLAIVTGRPNLARPLARRRPAPLADHTPANHEYAAAV